MGLTIREFCEEHRSALGWTNDNVINICGWTRKKLDQVLDATTQPSRQDVSRLVYAIIHGYDQVNGPRSPDDLEDLLNEALVLSGYRPLSAKQIFNDEMQYKQLRIAFPDWPPLISGNTSQPTGKLVPVVEAIALWALGCGRGRTQGAALEWIPTGWSDAPRVLREGRADLSGPLMKIPARECGDCQFTRPIPGFRIPVQGVTAAADRELSGPLLLEFVEGEIGEFIGPLIFANGVTQDREPHRTVEDAVEFLRTHPRCPKTSLPRVLVVDAELSQTLSNQYGLKILTGASTRFPIAFAAHPSERILIRKINRAISILAQTGYFAQNSGPQRLVAA